MFEKNKFIPRKYLKNDGAPGGTIDDKKKDSEEVVKDESATEEITDENLTKRKGRYDPGVFFYPKEKG